MRSSINFSLRSVAMASYHLNRSLKPKQHCLVALWYVAHFSFAFKLQNQDGRRQEKAQDDLQQKQSWYRDHLATTRKHQD